MKNIIETDVIEVASIQRMCLKIFYSATMYALPNLGVGSAVNIQLWITLIGKLFEKHLPEASEGALPSGQPTDLDERRQWPWWKVRDDQ